MIPRYTLVFIVVVAVVALVLVASRNSVARPVEVTSRSAAPEPVSPRPDAEGASFQGELPESGQEEMGSKCRRVHFNPERNRVVTIPRMVLKDLQDVAPNEDTRGRGDEVEEEMTTDRVAADRVVVSGHEWMADRDHAVEMERLELQLHQQRYRDELVDEVISELDMTVDHDSG
jgi:hypothetical protein